MPAPAPAVEPDRLARAVDRLTAAGYTHDLRAEALGLRDVTTGELVAPEDLIVDEMVRFEGASDPDDMSILLAVHDACGRLRATYATAFGPLMSEADAEVLPRIPPMQARLARAVATGLAVEVRRSRAVAAKPREAEAG